MKARHLMIGSLALTLGLSMAIPAAAAPSAEQALRLKPLQSNVDYDQPTAAEVDKCTIGPSKIGGRSAWVVKGPEGLVLRAFVDTNDDNTVDQWCYYKDGLEVYRDIDSDFDKRADQFRWLHTGGSRWGIDEDADGKIDRWRRISAQEATAEAVRALAKGDADIFACLLLTSDELKKLGLDDDKREQLKKQLDQAVDAFRKLSLEQRAVTEKTQWMQFSGGKPGIVPAGTDGANQDIEVYENVVAMVETDDQAGQVYVGTLINVGPTWRLIDVPQPMTDDAALAAQGFFFHPQVPRQTAAGGGGGGAPSEKVQELLTKLEELDAGTTSTEDAQYTLRRTELLEQIAQAVDTPSERNMWLRQAADMLSAAVQSGQLKDGDERLAELFNRLKKSGAGTDILAYIQFRQYAAEYALAFQQPKANFQEIQETWLEHLEQFVDDYPDSPDAAEAMLQLGIAHEFAGEEDKAKQWYGRVAQELPDSPAAKKAAGARRRLDAEGEMIEISGQTPDGGQVSLEQFRGKNVLVQYWATWCEPCKAHMAALKELLGKHGQDFAVIGVNLDNSVQDMAEYLKENRLPWPQIYEEGGLDSRPANQMGILTLPTMLLVDAQGRVVDRNVQIDELESKLKELTPNSAAQRDASRR